MVKWTITYPLAENNCPRCEFSSCENKKLKDHARNTHPWDCEIEYKCSACDKTSVNIFGVACHYPKCSKREGTQQTTKDKALDSAQEATYPCPICTKRFTTTRGVSVHQSRVHKGEWQAAHQIGPKRKVRWSQEEERIMARGEAAKRGGVYNLNQVAQVLLAERTLDSIKSKRRTKQFRRLVQQFRVEQGETDINGGDGSSMSGSHSDSQSELETNPSESGDEAASTERPSVEVRRPPEKDGRGPVTRSRAARAASEKVSTESRSESSRSRETLVSDPEECSRASSVIDEDPEAFSTLQDYIASLAAETPNESLDPAIFAGDLDEAVRIITSALPVKQNVNRGYRERPCKNRKQRYARAQRLYIQNPSRLVDDILLGKNGATPELSEPPTEEDVQQVFGELFSSPEVADDESYEASGQISDDLLLHSISPKDVSEYVKTMSGAGGPDGVTTVMLKGLRAVDLAKLFNLILWKRELPSSWKQCRTVLIPKADCNSSEAANNRPITLQSVFIRLLNKILAKRLSRLLPLSEKQFCGTGGDGCWMACTTLDTIVRSARKENQELNVAFLDVSKAFDSVHHSSILRGLRRFGVGEGFISYVSNLYEGVTTDICWSNKCLKGIPVTRGVKQGDPLSGLLFNLVLDEGLNRLSPDIGYQLGDSRIQALAYADDVALCSGSKLGMQTMLNTLSGFLEKRGLSLKPAKCCALRLAPDGGKRRIVLDRQPGFKVDGATIKVAKYGQNIKYLGTLFDPGGKSKHSAVRAIESMKKLQHAPLKPQQKLMLCREHLLPKFEYELSHGEVTKGTLETVDKEIRKFAKSVLHLPDCTHNGFFHSRIKEGGLGLQSFVERVPNLIVNNAAKLDKSENLILQAVAASQTYIHKLRKLRKIKKSTDSVKSVGQQGSTAACVAWRASNQGRHLEECEGSSISNAWLRRPVCSKLTGKDFVWACKLRAGVLPVRANTVWSEGGIRTCRHGCHSTETACHVLQACRVSHERRIVRHDRICKLLAQGLEKQGWGVQREVTCVVPTGNLRPDIVAIRKETALVIDPTIVWEGDKGLTAHNRFKCVKYKALNSEEFRRKWNVKSIQIHGLPIGTRGCWAPDSLKLWKVAGLPRGLAEFLIVRTLEESRRVFGTYMGSQAHG